MSGGACPHEWVETGKSQSGRFVTVYFRCVHCPATKKMTWAF